MNTSEPNRDHMALLIEMPDKKTLTDVDIPTDQTNMITLKQGELKSIQVNLNLILPTDDILSLKRKYFPDELQKKLQVRFIYMGRILNDQEIVKQQNWSRGQVVLVHVSQAIAMTASPEPVAPIQAQQIQNIGENIVRLEQQAAEIQAIMLELERMQAQNDQGQARLAQNIIREDINIQENEGTALDLVIGLFMGFIFTLFALIGLCMCQCSVKAKQGVMIGFILRIIYAQIILMHQTQ